VACACWLTPETSGVTAGGLSIMRQVIIDGAGARVAGGATVSDVLDAARSHGHATAQNMYNLAYRHDAKLIDTPG
jgi:hypothetical protein